VALVRIRNRYRVRGVECSNYRTFRTTVPLPLPHATIVALWQTWVSYWAAVSSFDCRFWGADADVYDDNVELQVQGHIHRPTVPIAGLIPLIGAVKPELCAGVVRVSDSMKRRLYQTGFPTEYVSDGQELTLIGDLALNQAEENIRIALDEVNVKWLAKVWEPVTSKYVQPELMTHNHRKVHVPFGLRQELPG